MPLSTFKRNVARLILIALSAALLALVIATRSAVTTAALFSARPPTVNSSSRQIALGVTIENAPSDLSVLRQYIGVAGSPPAIVQDFRGFGDPLFYSSEPRNLRAIGATPMVTWAPVINGVGLPLASVAAGTYDGYIRIQAQLARAWRRPMYIRFAHEMNLQASPWAAGKNGNTPALYVAAWRHVVTVFRQAGATNVRWVWSPNVDCLGNCPFAAYYPGDAWVTDVALDGYNFAGAHNVPWVSFATLFAPSYALLGKITHKPVIIAETAAPETGGSKPDWITEAFLRDIPSQFSRVSAVVWWDRVDQTDWRVNSSPASLRAWREVVTSPLYKG